MIPIYEQGNGRSIGLSYDQFTMRFREICKQHLATKRAKAFAMLFYDFENEQLKKYLKKDGFTTLDRLSGKDISVFYLHTKSSKDMIDKYNQQFKRVWEYDETISPPFMLFIKFNPEVNKVVDFQCVILEQHNSIVGFTELYQAIENYKSTLDEKKQSSIKSDSLRVINLLGEAVVNVGLEQVIEGFLTTLTKL